MNENQVWKESDEMSKWKGRKQLPLWSPSITDKTDVNVWHHSRRYILRKIILEKWTTRKLDKIVILEFGRRLLSFVLFIIQAEISWYGIIALASCSSLGLTIEFIQFSPSDVLFSTTNMNFCVFDQMLGKLYIRSDRASWSLTSHPVLGTYADELCLIDRWKWMRGGAWYHAPIIKLVLSWLWQCEQWR